MKYLNNHYHFLVNNDSNLKKYIDQMEKEIDTFYQNFYDDPKYISEWGHYYFCDDDGGRLKFNLATPHLHECEICKRNFQGPIYDGVWWYFYRNEAVKTMLKSAAVYQATRNNHYLEVFKVLMLFYADNYLKFPIHNKERQTFQTVDEMKWGCGRILPQGLNESIITSRMVQALEIVKEDLEEEFLENIFEKMFKHIYALLKPQVNHIHNISCWNNVAIGMIGLFFHKSEIINYAFHGPFNIIRQFDEGVTSDYFWYEGSIHYNFFTLEGVTMLYLFSEIYDNPFPKKTKEKLVNMFEAGYHFAFNNHYFPNPNDGWPSINLKTYSYIYHTMVKCLGYHSKIGNILKLITLNESKRTTLPLSKPIYLDDNTSFEQFVMNTDFSTENVEDIEQKTLNFPKSNYGMIRNPYFNVFLKYGHNSRSHAHPDCMNIEIMAGDTMITRDLSNAGYRARLCNEWHRTTPSHTTVVVDGKNQISTHPGKILAYEKNLIKAECLDVYPGVDFIRELKLKDNQLEDTFFVESKEEHVYDYFFHFESNWTIQTEEVGIDRLNFCENGYQHISDIKRIKKNDSSNCVLKFATKNQLVLLDIDLENKEAYLAKTLDNPVNRNRTTLIVRAKGKNIIFKTTLKREEI